METTKKTIRGRVKQIKKIVDRIDTYDIQTTNQNFFANGVLVHNSEIILRDKEFCNLSEVVVRKEDNEETLKRKIRLATILGTFQSTLTNFKYISGDWTTNCQDERLLGVSLTGILDNSLMNGRKGKEKLTNLLHSLRKEAIKVNEEWSRTLKVNPSAAITCVKPSGCTTLETEIKTSEGVVSMRKIFELSGVDPHSIQEDTFIEPSVEMFVYDENNDLRKITNLYVKGFAPTIEIEDDQGNIYKFSPRHQLKTKDGWKYVTEITENDEILSFNSVENAINTYNLSV